ncbi:receptor-type tyrosine-protein phosphatase eta-like, partial [Scleropages formosus]
VILGLQFYKNWSSRKGPSPVQEPEIRALCSLSAPDVIRSLYVAEVTTSSVFLNWSDSQGYHSFYKVQWNNNNEVKSVSKTSAPVNISNLTTATAYTFTVTAVAADNITEGAAVSITQFTIKCNYNNVFQNQTTNFSSITIVNLLPGIQYTFSVIAVTGDNKTEGAPISLSQFTRPDVITNFSVSQITTSSLSLTWSAPQGNISFYIVQWIYNNNTNNQTVNSAYIYIPSLLPGVQYTFSVIAVAGDNKTRGAPVSLSQFTKPAKPGNISSINPGNSTLTIYWSLPQGNVVWYEVNIASYSSNMTSNSTSSTNYTMSGLSAGILNNITVTSVSGPFRNTSDVVQFATKPNPPANIRIQEKTNSSVSLVWDRPLMDASVNVTFNITYMPAKGNISQSIASSQNHIQFTGLVSGTQYCYCVAAVGWQGLSSSTVCQVPNPVQNLKASSVSINSIRLDWGSPAGFQPYYTYQVQITNASGLVENVTVAQNYTEILNLVPGSRYNATVTTITSSNAYSVSQVTICQTKPRPVGNLTAMAVSTTAINLTWTSQDYDQGSYLYLVSISQSDLGRQGTNTTDKRFSFSNLIPGTSYNFTVIAVVNGVPSDTATALNFTKPEKATNIMAVGTTSSLIVTWNSPKGNYEFVRITVYSNISVVYTQIPLSSNSTVVSNLRPGQLYSLILSTKNPNPPNSIQVEQQTTNSINISWERPVNMDIGQYDFIVYSQGNKTRSSNNWINLGNLTSATGYNISVVTIGLMAYMSTPVALQVFTLPKSISQLHASEITASNVTLVWEPPDSRDVYQYLITVVNTNVSLDTWNTSANIGGLQSGTNYTFSVITQGHSGFNASATFTSLFTRPYSIGPVDSNALNTTAVYLNWTRPPEYQNGYSYRVEISGCLPAVKNQSVQTEVAHIAGLIPGTNCSFRIYSQAANGIEGTPVTTFQYTMPEKVVPHVSNGGTNHSIAVEWDSPRGNVEKYGVSLRSPQGGAVYQELTSTARSCLFTNLTAGNPNKPGHITVQNKTTNTISLEWMDAPGMDNGSFTYMVTYQSAMSMETRNVSRNTADLSSLDSGTSYNISVATVGPMGLVSETVAVFLVTTKPEQVQFLNINSTSAEEVVLTWSKPIDFKSGYLYRVVTTYSTNSVMNTTTSTETYRAVHLIPGTLYTFMISTLTWDGTESSNVLVSNCTDAAPVLDLTCQGPDLTAAVLTLSWSNPKGLNKGFEVQVMDNVTESIPTCDPTCTHNVAGLSYNTQYSVSLQTQGCGKSSAINEIPCKTGITVPPVPDAETYVKVTEVEFDKFTLELNSSLFNYTNGPIVNYAILVTSNMDSVRGQSLSSLTKYLNKTYQDWAAGQVSTYLAVVKDNLGTSQNGDNSVVVIGDSTKWQSYSNGPLKARGVYSFAVVMFTRLEEKDGFVDISASYVSVSSFHQRAISLPENPVVIASIAGVVSCLLILFVFIALAVIYFKRAKVSVPIKVENFEEYFRKQRANSNCGFAEEFENLKSVGVAQAKSSALAPENKGKNRYNNGYNSRKEFIAAQGPLPSTVNEFWRMIWEKNVRTLVMLTRCNEQGRVKCEEYWPSSTKHFNNITVTATSEIVMEDWTIREFDVKNVKTAENRNLQQFHFTAWPDHGVPETTELLINFRHLVREHMDEFSRNSPTVVHC